jgi:lipopolysaccharide transport system permease protein
VIPTASVLSGLVDFVVAACILAGMMAFYHATTTLYGVALVPVLLLIAVIASLGAGMFLSALNVKYRDVRYALPFLIQTLMFVTPVIYPVSLLSKIPPLKIAVMACNPIAGVIDTARATLLRGESANWATLGTSALSACVFFVIGLYFFRAMERHFADII